MTKLALGTTQGFNFKRKISIRDKDKNTVRIIWLTDYSLIKLRLIKLQYIKQRNKLEITLEIEYSHLIMRLKAVNILAILEQMFCLQ